MNKKDEHSLKIKNTFPDFRLNCSCEGILKIFSLFLSHLRVDKLIGPHLQGSCSLLGIGRDGHHLPKFFFVFLINDDRGKTRLYNHRGLK